MLKKASRQFLTDYMPQLATHYVRACKSVYKYVPYIHKSVYPKFSVFEDDLRDLSISTKDYADTVTILMRKFVDNKGWKTLPVNLFLSDYCLKRYKKIKNTKTVEAIDTDAQALLYSELLVARLFIERNIGNTHYVRFSDAVEDLEPLLSKLWLELYDSGEDRSIVDQALDILATEYNVKPANSYLDLLDMLR